MMRHIMSRPTSSLPNGCAGDGGARNSLGSTLFAAVSGTIIGAMTHTPTITARVMQPTRAIRCRRKRRHASWERERELPAAELASEATGRAAVSGSLSATHHTHSRVTNTWIQVGVHNIGEKVEHHHHHRCEHQYAHQHRDVGALGLVPEQAAHARPCEN